jgi:TRAP-type C4-dicarboxylate transport system substrate-binding protein
MGEGKAVRSFEDLKGKKYLSTGPWDAATWEAFGMVPMSMMPDETYLNLQTGVCDGATLTLASLFDFGWGDVTPYITETNVRPGAFQLVINLDKWNSLPDEYQKIIMEEAAKVPERQDQQQLRFDRDLRDDCIEKWGTEFIPFTQADYDKMEELSAPVKEKFAADLDAMGLPGTELLNEAMSLQVKYSGQEYALK